MPLPAAQALPPPRRLRPSLPPTRSYRRRDTHNPTRDRKAVTRDRGPARGRARPQRDRASLLDGELDLRLRPHVRVVVIGEVDLELVLARREVLVGDRRGEGRRVVAGHPELLGDQAVLARVLREVELALVHLEVEVALAWTRRLADGLRRDLEVRELDRGRDRATHPRLVLGRGERDGRLGTARLLGARGRVRRARLVV